jgi:hypothetical protein
MLVRQRAIVADLAAAVAPGDDADVVRLWRQETAAAALRFLDQLL